VSALTPSRLPSWLDNASPRELWRWAVAGVVVLGVHAGVVAYAVSTRQTEDIGGDTDVMTVELAPIDSTPDAVAQDVAPAPETMVEAKPQPAPQQETPKEEMKIEQPPDETPSPVPLPEVKPPEKADIAPAPAPRTAQQVKGGAPHIEPTWQTSLVRQLQRFKRYPPGAQARKEEGVVLLNFSLDRNGHVIARSIAKSSGYADLDSEVLAMIERAEPLPAFPQSMPQAQLDLTVPIRFSLR
jgi:periplasmic protein TonB